MKLDSLSILRFHSISSSLSSVESVEVCDYKGLAGREPLPWRWLDVNETSNVEPVQQRLRFGCLRNMCILYTMIYHYCIVL